MASHLYDDLNPKSDYIDKSLKLSKEDYDKKLKVSATVYVGNLSIYTREESIYELFSQCGCVREIKIGINKKAGTPIGFCFVEYFTHESAGYAVNCLSQTKLDNRVIRVDWDVGFSEGRQFGRGKMGLQWRDCFREKEDPERPKLPPQKNYQSGGGPYKKFKRNDDNKEYDGNKRRYNNDRNYGRKDEKESDSDRDVDENYKRNNK